MMATEFDSHILYVFIFCVSEHGLWSPWGLWTECTRTCDGGEQRRQRSCAPPKFGGKECLGDRTQIRKCNVVPCHSEYISEC